MRMMLGWTVFALLGTAAFAAEGEIQTHTVAGVATTANRNVLARGSAFEVTGTGLGPAERVAAEVPLPDWLDGVAIELVSADGTAVFLTPLISVAADRLVAIVPSAAPPGAYRLTVLRGDARGNPVEVTIAGADFGLVTNANAGGGQVYGRLLADGAEPEAMTYLRPAYPGARLELDAAGLGAIDGPDSEYPAEVNQAGDALLVMGELQIPVEYLGRNPLRPGFDKVIVTLPAEGLPAPDCSVSFQLIAGGVSTSTVTLPLSPQAGLLCSNSFGLDEAGLKTLSEGGSIIKGGFDVANGIVSSMQQGFSYDSAGDGFSGGFVRYTAGEFAVLMANAQVLKPYFDHGGCFVHDALEGPAGEYVDAGEAVTLTGPAWSLQVPQSGPPRPNIFSATLTSVIVGFPVVLPSLGLPLTPGKYVVEGTGGSVVGPFRAEVEMSPGFTWTNAAAVTDTVDRKKDLVFQWTGGGANDVMQALGVVTGPSPEDPGRIVTRIFMCSGHGRDGHLVVPSPVLNQMPVVPQVKLSGPGPAWYGTVVLSQAPAPNQGIFSAPLAAGGTTQGAAFTFGYSHTKSPLAFP